MKTHARAILTATAAVAAVTLIGAPAADAKPAPNSNLNASYCLNVLGGSGTATFNIVKSEKQCVTTTSEVTYGAAEPTNQASADGTLLLTYGKRLVTTSRVVTGYIQRKSEPIRAFVISLPEVVSTTSENIDVLCFQVDSTGGSTPTAVEHCTAAGLLPN